MFANEYDPKTAAWLQQLVTDGYLPETKVDSRDIRDITPNDLAGFRQCHFFAGIAGWPYALRLAGWPEDREVWTGSCPCQPFSAAGKGKGVDDSRHLWPAFRWLIAQRRPATIFGEQVASSDGREWLDGIRADLEAMGYAVGAADLCVAGVGAPHIRQRLFWVADAKGEGWPHARQPRTIGGKASKGTRSKRPKQRSATTGGLVLPNVARSQRHAEDGDNGNQPGWIDTQPNGPIAPTSPWNQSIPIECSDGKYRRVPVTANGEIEPAFFPLADGIPARVVRLRGYGNAIVPQVAAVFVREFMEIKKQLS